MSTLFILDIDGTIADFGRRLKEAGPEPSRQDKAAYEKWVNLINRGMEDDTPVEGMQSLARGIIFLDTNEVVYLTGREEKHRKITEDWLERYKFHGKELVMRPDDNYQETHEFKEDAIDDMIVNFRPDAVVVIDDDQSGELEKVCKRRGWTFLKACSGSGK
jgi:hypothetical protein